MILLADDEEINRYYLSTVLQRENWTVHEAADGREALALIRNHPFDLILLDVTMPGIDGFQVVREIRRMNRSIPVLAVTAHSDCDEELKKAGMTDVLLKPVNEQQLLQMIRQYASGDVFSDTYKKNRS